MKRPVLNAFIITVLACSCSVQPATYRKTFKDINSFNEENGAGLNEPFFKAHLKSGGLCIYSDTIWTFNDETNIIRGNAKLYDAHRALLKQGVVEINADTVVLFESNRKVDVRKRKTRLATHTIITAFDATLGVICISVPKACWGSCPTFYSGKGDYVFNADAEGFSEAIIPSMEYGDIDALYNFSPEERDFSIVMKNEALETHVVRNVKILAVEKDPALRVFHSNDDRFLLSDKTTRGELISAFADEGDISALLSEADQRERFSPSDRNNMISREDVILNFSREGISEAGLVLNFRQTLMTTYLIYSVMGYMGNTVSDFLAEVEKNNQTLRKHKLIDEELGGIEVYLVNEGKEVLCGIFNETGPIATNQQIIPLGKLPETENIKIKLVLNRGLWRIDYATLVPVLGEIQPVSLDPTELSFNKENDPGLLQDLISDSEQLVSMPGDEYEFRFRLPEENTEYDLFLYSKGYYLEWMRESWLNDKNLLKLHLLMENPDRFFRKEARNFSRYESEMEEIFLNSRIDTEKFNYHE